MSLQLDYELKKGNEIEKINPNQNEKIEILKQISDLKKLTAELVKNKFPNSKENNVNHVLETYFTVYEMSPDSIVQIAAKKPLSKEQFDLLKEDLGKTSESYKIDKDNNKIDENAPEDLKDFAQTSKIGDFVMNLSALIGKEFHKKIPDDFHIQEKSDRLVELSKWFENKVK